MAVWLQRAYVGGGGGVRCADTGGRSQTHPAAEGRVDGRADDSLHLQNPRAKHFAPMQEEAPAASLLHVRDANGGCAVLAVQCAPVPNLAARLCVERAAVQHQLHSLARQGAAGGLAVH